MTTKRLLFVLLVVSIANPGFAQPRLFGQQQQVQSSIGDRALRYEAGIGPFNILNKDHSKALKSPPIGFSWNIALELTTNSRFSMKVFASEQYMSNAKAGFGDRIGNLSYRGNMVGAMAKLSLYQNFGAFYERPRINFYATIGGSYAFEHSSSFVADGVIYRSPEISPAFKSKWRGLIIGTGGSFKLGQSLDLTLESAGIIQAPFVDRSFFSVSAGLAWYIGNDAGRTYKSQATSRKGHSTSLSRIIRKSLSEFNMTLKCPNYLVDSAGLELDFLPLDVAGANRITARIFFEDENQTTLEIAQLDSLELKKGMTGGIVPIKYPIPPKEDDPQPGLRGKFKVEYTVNSERRKPEELADCTFDDVSTYINTDDPGIISQFKKNQPAKVIEIIMQKEKPKQDLHNLAIAYMLVGNTPLALETINESITVKPYLYTSYIIRALLLKHQGDMNGALENIVHAINAEPRSKKRIFSHSEFDDIKKRGKFSQRFQPSADERLKWILDRVASLESTGVWGNDANSRESMIRLIEIGKQINGRDSYVYQFDLWAGKIHYDRGMWTESIPEVERFIVYAEKQGGMAQSVDQAKAWLKEMKKNAANPEEASPCLNVREDMGKYYALLISAEIYDKASEYQDLSNVKTSMNTLKAVLENQYGFEVDQLEDPTHDQIDYALSKIKKKPAENILIVFSGHGYQDDLDEGYWCPRDVVRVNKELITNGVSNSEVIHYMKGFNNAKRVFVVSDACYSGTLNLYKGDGGPDLDNRIKEASSRWSRSVLTSTPVGQQKNDDGTFMERFTNFLVNNNGCLFGLDLIVKMKGAKLTPTPGGGNVNAFPKYADGSAMDGDFIFVPLKR